MKKTIGDEAAKFAREATRDTYAAAVAAHRAKIAHAAANTQHHL